MQATFATEAAFFVAAEWACGIEFVVSVGPNDAGPPFVHDLENLLDALWARKNLRENAACGPGKTDSYSKHPLEAIMPKLFLILPFIGPIPPHFYVAMPEPTTKALMIAGTVTLTLLAVFLRKKLG